MARSKINGYNRFPRPQDIAAEERNFILSFIGNLELLHKGDAIKMMAAIGAAALTLCGEMKKYDQKKVAEFMRQWGLNLADAYLAQDQREQPAVH
jgi:hypothetical protein